MHEYQHNDGENKNEEFAVYSRRIAVNSAPGITYSINFIRFYFPALFLSLVVRNLASLLHAAFIIHKIMSQTPGQARDFIISQLHCIMAQ